MPVDREIQEANAPDVIAQVNFDVVVNRIGESMKKSKLIGAVIVETEDIVYVPDKKTRLLRKRKKLPFPAGHVDVG